MDEFLTGTVGADSILGGAGNDTILGGDGNDTLRGGADNDSLVGGNDDDLLTGGDGDDHLSDGYGSDTLDGGAGYNTFQLQLDVELDRIRIGTDFDHEANIIGFQTTVDKLDLTRLSDAGWHDVAIGQNGGQVTMQDANNVTHVIADFFAGSIGYGDILI